MSTLKDTILLSLAVVAFLIGVHRTIVEGLYQNYWLFMVSLGLLMWFRYSRKTAGHKKEGFAAPPQAHKPVKKKKQR